jgi:hypothetical protein
MNKLPENWHINLRQYNDGKPDHPRVRKVLKYLDTFCKDTKYNGSAHWYGVLNNKPYYIRLNKIDTIQDKINLGSVELSLSEFEDLIDGKEIVKNFDIY